jgi:hypothetical protein
MDSILLPLTAGAEGGVPLPLLLRVLHRIYVHAPMIPLPHISIKCKLLHHNSPLLSLF